MTTMTDINNELSIVFYKLKNGEIDAKVATEMVNAAGKMIGVAKVQIAYAALRGEKPNIPFLMGEIEKLENSAGAAIEKALPAIRNNAIAKGAFPSGAFEVNSHNNYGKIEGGKK